MPNRKGYMVVVIWPLISGIEIDPQGVVDGVIRTLESVYNRKEISLITAISHSEHLMWKAVTDGSEWITVTGEKTFSKDPLKNQHVELTFSIPLDGPTE